MQGNVSMKWLLFRNEVQPEIVSLDANQEKYRNLNEIIDSFIRFSDNLNSSISKAKGTAGGPSRVTPEEAHRLENGSLFTVGLF